MRKSHERYRKWKRVRLSEEVYRNLRAIVFEHARDRMSEQERADMTDALWQEMYRDRRNGERKDTEPVYKPPEVRAIEGLRFKLRGQLQRIIEGLNGDGDE